MIKFPYFNQINIFVVFSTLIFVLRSILDLNAVSGSFVVNPPMKCDELIEAALNHIDRLLTESNEPLSFVVMLTDSESSFVKKLDSSLYKRRQVVVPAYEHFYRHGFQYNIPKYVYATISVLFIMFYLFFIGFSDLKLIYGLQQAHW
jgi:hypothetical protein